MAEPFKIHIETTGDPKGAEQVAASLGKVAKATDENSKASRTLDEDLQSLGSRQNAAKDVLEGLDAAAKGNVNSIFGLAKAFKNLGDIFTVSTPAGRAFQLAIVAAGAAAQVLGRETAAAGDQAQDASKDFEGMRAATEAFGKVRFDELNAQLDGLKAKTESNLTFFKRLAEVSKTLDDASMSLELAQLNSNVSLSDEEKKKREAQIRDRYGRRGLERDEGLRGEELKALTADATNTRAKADAVNAERAIAEFLLNGLTGRRAAVNTRMLESNSQFLAEGAASLNPRQYEEARRRQEARIAPIKAEQAQLFTPGVDEMLKIYQQRLDAATAKTTEAEKAAAAAEAKLADALRIKALEEKTAREAADLAQRTRYTAAGLDLPGTRRAPESEPARNAGVVVDSFSLQAMAREQGKTTGQVLADLVQASLQANNAAITEEVANRLRRTQN